MTNISKSHYNAEAFMSEEVVTASERTMLNKLLDRVKVELFYSKGGNAGFLGSLIANLEFTWDRTIPTACTNGVFMAWNPDFFLELDNKTRVTVLAHEAWHVAFQHMGRFMGRDPEDWNSAADHVINLMLKEHGFYMDGFPYLMDDAYKGMTTEQVYDLISEERKNGGMPGKNHQNGDFSEVGPPSMQGGMTPEQIARKATGNIMDAAAAANMSKDAGNIPGEVQQMINEFLKPKLNWRTLLLNFFDGLSEPEYSYRAVNRRYVDPILPGKTNGQGLENILYCLDVSGSISDQDIIRFNSEVKYIKDTYNPEKLTLLTFDTKIQDVHIFEQDDEFNEITVTGRGGTDLREVFKYIEENQQCCVVIFSDLYVSMPKDDPKVPIIWICIDNPDGADGSVWSQAACTCAAWGQKILRLIWRPVNGRARPAVMPFRATPPPLSVKLSGPTAILSVCPCLRRPIYCKLLASGRAKDYFPQKSDI